jgi:hypothetical protein
LGRAAAGTKICDLRAFRRVAATLITISRTNQSTEHRFVHETAIFAPENDGSHRY